jgi:hypothetical protein
MNSLSTWLGLALLALLSIAFAAFIRKRLAGRSLDSETLKNEAAAIQSIVTALGIVLGGAWALFSFWALGATARARAEIAKFEKDAAQQAVLEMEIQSTKIGATSAAGTRRIAVSAKFKNDGQRALSFCMPDWVIEKIDTDAKPAAIKENAWHGNTRVLEIDQMSVCQEWRVLRAGQTRTIAFFLTVPSPGQYMRQVNSLYAGTDLKIGLPDPAPDEPAIMALEQAALDVP